MNDAPESPGNVQEYSGLSFDLKFEPKEPPVRPIWRFLIAAIFIEATDWVALNFASNVLTRHPILQDALYRFSGAAVLLVGFHFMMRVLDEVDDKEIFPQLGFPRRYAFPDLLVGIAISTGLILVAVVLISIGGGYTMQIRIVGSVWKKVAEVLLLLAMGATYEELSFRGYAFQRLTQAVGPVYSIVLFSVWFGAVHLWNPHAGGILSWSFFNTLAVGALFAIAYLRTRALWLPIGMHFGWNFALGTLFGLPVSGLGVFAVAVHGRAIGPKWLTGGHYGLEASATGALVIVLGAVPVLLYTRYRSDSRIASPSI